MNEPKPITVESMIVDAFGGGPVRFRHRHYETPGKPPSRWTALYGNSSDGDRPFNSLDALMHRLEVVNGWKIRPGANPLEFQLLYNDDTLAHDVEVVFVDE